MVYTIISEDGRIFFDEESDYKEILKKAIIPLKIILDNKNNVVWRKENGTN